MTLPIHYGDEPATLVRLTRAGPRPTGIVLVKSDLAEDGRCPEHCHKAIIWGRVYCPLLTKPINADRCKRMRRKSPEALREYLERIANTQAQERRHKRQERQAHQDQALRLAQEGQAKAKAQGKGEREPMKKESGGETVMTTGEKAGPQAAIPKSQQPKPGRNDHKPSGQSLTNRG